MKKIRDILATTALIAIAVPVAIGFVIVAVLVNSDGN